MSTGQPRFSIITPCLNRVEFMEQALASVRAQEFPDTEHIVVDGGSTDGTLEMLARAPGITLISGPDRGMYDALNKGLRASRGDYVGFLNSDDVYARGAFAAAHARLDASALAAVAGNAEFFRGDAAGGEVVYRWCPDDADLLTLATTLAPAMNAWFFRRTALAALGEFDADYRIAGDREFMLRFALAAPRCASVGALFYRYRQHQGSMTIGGGDPRVRARMTDEHLAMTRRWLGRPGLPPRARALLRELRRRDTLDMAARCAHAGEVRALLRYAAAGTRHDPAWCLHFMVRAARSALGGP